MTCFGKFFFLAGAFLYLLQFFIVCEAYFSILWSGAPLDFLCERRMGLESADTAGLIARIGGEGMW